jgi:hypothetical protein
VIRQASALGAAVVTACLLSAAAVATTSPDVLHHVTVILTNTTIQIPKDQFVKKDGITRYPRGALIEFTLENKSSKPISVQMSVVGGSSITIAGNRLAGVASAGKPIAPGAVRHWKLSFYFRGKFQMVTKIGGKVAVKRPIIIF